jgi:hypothetical protein
MDAPSAMGDRVAWYILSDPTYIDGGSSITDPQLQGAAETAINAYFIPVA